MSRKKTLRLIVSGSLLAAVTLVGVSVYQVEKNQQERLELQESAETDDKEEEIIGGNTTEEEERPHYSVVNDEEEEIPPAEETTSDQVIANEEETEETAGEMAGETAKETSGTSVIVPEVSFSEDTMLDWPVNGTIIMDYSMDHTVYFPTLDVYKYNPSLILSAQEGEPVEAAANCEIVSIEENMETGLTITADMGNGYQTVYGQLKDVLVEEGDVITAGTVLGYIEQPTHFYTEEGSNLYFAMTRDGESVDPILYLP